MKKFEDSRRRPLALLLAVCILAATIFSGCGQQAPAPEETAGTVLQETQPVQTEASATEAPEASVQIDMAYLSVTVPESRMAELKHQEVTEGAVAMEIFSMALPEKELELFRIYFNDPATGKHIGNLLVGEEEIPVSVTVCEYTSAAFPDAETQARYYELMETLNEVLAAIRSSSGFSAQESPAVEKTEKTVSYWTFSLPEGVHWEENRENGDYRVVFRGTIGGRQIDLYTVAVSQDVLRTVLGLYTAEGVSKPVSVESYELPNTEGWPEGEIIQLYTMMDSINDVIQTIMADEDFREAVPEA